MIRLRCTQDAADFRAFYDRDPPEIWLGVVAEENERPIGFGQVWWDEWGRAWGGVDGPTTVSRFTLHRWAKKVIAALAKEGEPAIHAFCGSDEKYPGASLWLRHLGFSPAPELTTNPEHPVWRCDL